jgi:hypothetical protein
MNVGHITMGTQFLKGIHLRWQCNEELLGFKTQERDARFCLFWADFEKIGENWNPEKRWVKMSVP